MNENNVITIKGGSFRDIRKALRRWIDLYFDDSDSHLTFELYKNGRINFVIKADEGLDNESFFYLVNYLQNPEDNEYEVEIEGFTTGEDRAGIFGKKILVYVSPTDTEGDNVFAVTPENKHYKIDFAGKTVSIQDEKFHKPLPDLGGLENPIILTPRKLRTPADREGIFKKNTPENRFKIGSLVIAGLFLACPLLVLYDLETFRKTLYIIGIITGVWFVSDYEMLQSNSLYIRCLGLAIFFLTCELSLNYIFPNERGYMLLGTLMPITILLIQKPLRFLFVNIFEEEPESSSANAVYEFIFRMLLFLALLLPIIIQSYLIS